MIDYLIVLGQIPGTEYYISFTHYLIIVGMLLVSLLIYIERRSIRLFLIQVQLLRLRLPKL